MKILKRVTVEFDFVIVVDLDNPTMTEEDIARDTIEDAFHDISVFDLEYSFDDYNNNVFGYDGNSVPYDDDGSSTIKQILNGTEDSEDDE